jgi:hypothetical protein
MSEMLTLRRSPTHPFASTLASSSRARSSTALSSTGRAYRQPGLSRSKTGSCAVYHHCPATTDHQRRTSAPLYIRSKTMVSTCHTSRYRGPTPCSSVSRRTSRPAGKSSTAYSTYKTPRRRLCTRMNTSAEKKKNRTKARVRRKNAVCSRPEPRSRRQNARRGVPGDACGGSYGTAPRTSLAQRRRRRARAAGRDRTSSLGYRRRGSATRSELCESVSSLVRCFSSRAYLSHGAGACSTRRRAGCICTWSPCFPCLTISAFGLSAYLQPL